jgi:A/G-specific adenine glycosylase
MLNAYLTPLNGVSCASNCLLLSKTTLPKSSRQKAASNSKDTQGRPTGRPCDIYIVPGKGKMPVKGIKMTQFSARILEWYEKNARVLPWRGHPDSYAIWVSEIMLQQTRVETVIPYFERWLGQFPTITALAAASEQRVLSVWEGLGYYSRARNLHKAAKMVVTEFNGQLPYEITQLRKLPGIGRYTAAAIASIAFNQDIATLDGNLRRVFARVFDVDTPADSPAGEEILWALAQKHLPAGRAGDYNQALMDLGASVCLPRKPLCLFCPLGELCKSRSAPENRPVLKPKATVPHRLKMAAVILQEDNVLLALRPAKGLLGGLWEFPAAEVGTDSPEALVAAIETEYWLKVSPIDRLTEVRHAYTHFTLTESAWHCVLIQKTDVELPFEWVPLESLTDYPMGKVDRAIAKLLSTATARGEQPPVSE